MLACTECGVEVRCTCGFDFPFTGPIQVQGFMTEGSSTDDLVGVDLGGQAFKMTPSVARQLAKTLNDRADFVEGVISAEEFTFRRG